MTRKPGAIPFDHIVQIVIVIGLIVAVIVMKRQCGEATEQMFRAIDAVPLSVTGDGGN